MNIMRSVLFVYIGALLKSGNVVCQKQSQEDVVGKSGRKHKKFQSTFEPNRYAGVLLLVYGRCSLTAGEDRCRAQKLQGGAGRFRGGGAHAPAIGAGSAKSEY